MKRACCVYGCRKSRAPGREWCELHVAGADLVSAQQELRTQARILVQSARTWGSAGFPLQEGATTLKQLRSDVEEYEVLQRQLCKAEDEYDRITKER